MYRGMRHEHSTWYQQLKQIRHFFIGKFLETHVISSFAATKKYFA